METQVLINRVLIIIVTLLVSGLIYVVRLLYRRYFNNVFFKNRSIEFSPAAIISVNTEGEVVGWNRGAEKLTGYKENEILNKTLENLIPVENRDGYEMALKEIALTQAQEFTDKVLHTDILTKFNVRIPVEVLMWQWTQDKVIYYTGVARDVTQEHERIREITGELELLKTGEHIDNSGVWDWNVIKDEVVISDGFKRIFDVTTPAATADYLMRRIYYEDRQLVVDAIERAMQTGEGYEITYRVMAQDSRILRLDCHATVRKNPEGQITNLVGTIRVIP